MGVLALFDEDIKHEDTSARIDCAPHRIEVRDNHAIPEIVVGPIGSTGDESGTMRVSFHDWQQFERFVDAINSLQNRLQKINMER